MLMHVSYDICDSYHNCDMLHPTIVKVAKCHNRSALLKTWDFTKA